MSIFTRCFALVDPLHLRRNDGCSHVHPVGQLIALRLGLLFHSQGQVLHPHLDFAGEQLAFCIKSEVVFVMCIPELARVGLLELPLVMESEFVGGANIGSTVRRVLFLSLIFNYNISQVLSISLWSSEYIKESHAGVMSTRFSGVTISKPVSPTICRTVEVLTRVKSHGDRA